MALKAWLIAEAIARTPSTSSGPSRPKSEAFFVTTVASISTDPKSTNKDPGQVIHRTQDFSSGSKGKGALIGGFARRICRGVSRDISTANTSVSKKTLCQSTFPAAGSAT